MTRSVGVDVVDVPRFTTAITRHPRLVARLFTDREQRDARARPERLAARFAAKEAVLKSLHVGLGATTWHSIEVHRSPEGVPSVHLSGTALELAQQRGIATLHLSMSHTDMTAVAFVVGDEIGAP